MGHDERKQEEQNQSEDSKESRFWKLARSYNRPHVDVLKALYGQSQHALTTKEIYRKTSHDISDRQKRNVFERLDEDGLVDYVKGNPSLVAKKESIEDSVDDLIEVWNKVNSV